MMDSGTMLLLLIFIGQAPTNQLCMCTTVSYSSNVGISPSHKRPCAGTHQFLCENKSQTTSLATQTTSTLKSTISPVAINAFPRFTVNNTVLYVNYQPMAYQNASRFCQLNFNGNLVASGIILSVGPGLGNYLRGNLTYWLQQGKTNGQCNILYNDGNSSSWNVSSDKCDSHLPVICKYPNVTLSTSPSLTPTSTSMIQATTVSTKVTKLAPSSAASLSTNVTTLIPSSATTVSANVTTLTPSLATIVSTNMTPLTPSLSTTVSAIITTLTPSSATKVPMNVTTLTPSSAASSSVSANVTALTPSSITIVPANVTPLTPNSATIVSANVTTLTPRLATTVSSNITTLAPSSTTTESKNVTTLTRSSGPKGWHIIGESEYRLSSGGCSYSNADHCCQAVGGHLSPTLDSWTLTKILKILPKFGYDGKIWIKGTSCILGHSALAPYCDILTIINGVPAYNKTNVNDIHFCLCRRPVTPAVHNRLPCTEFYPNWKQVGSMEFWKSGRPRTYNKAKVQCEKEGSELVDQRRLHDPKFLSILELTKSDGAFWTKSDNATSTCSAIIIENNHHRLANKTCSSVLYSVCERSIPDSTIFVSAPSRSITTSTSNASTALPSVPGWTKNRRHEYYISYDDVTNSEAETYCRDKLNSSLTFFTMATAYFRMAEELSLTAGEYWVGVGIASSSNDSCLLLHVHDWNPSSLVQTDCSALHNSICRRPVQNETFTFEPEFLQMLQEMTIPQKSTHARRRKFTSATDYRTSSKAMGLVGLGVVLLVSLIIVGFDLSNLKGCPKRRRRTVSSSTA